MTLQSLDPKLHSSDKEYVSQVTLTLTLTLTLILGLVETLTSRLAPRYGCRHPHIDSALIALDLKRHVIALDM